MAGAENDQTSRTGFLKTQTKPAILPGPWGTKHDRMLRFSGRVDFGPLDRDTVRVGRAPNRVPDK